MGRSLKVNLIDGATIAGFFGIIYLAASFTHVAEGDAAIRLRDKQIVDADVKPGWHFAAWTKETIRTYKPGESIPVAANLRTQNISPDSKIGGTAQLFVQIDPAMADGKPNSYKLMDLFNHGNAALSIASSAVHAKICDDALRGGETLSAAEYQKRYNYGMVAEMQKMSFPGKLVNVRFGMHMSGPFSGV